MFRRQRRHTSAYMHDVTEENTSNMSSLQNLQTPKALGIYCENKYDTHQCSFTKIKSSLNTTSDGNDSYHYALKD